MEYPKNRSNHNPLLAQIEKMWLTCESLEDNIKVWWQQSFLGALLAQIAKKLRFIKKNLKVWNRETFGSLHRRKEELQAQFIVIEGEIQEQGLSEDLKSRELEMLEKWNNVLMQEEIMWK